MLQFDPLYGEYRVSILATQYHSNDTECVPQLAATGEMGFVSTMLQFDPLYGVYRVSTFATEYLSNRVSLTFGLTFFI